MVVPTSLSSKTLVGFIEVGAARKTGNFISVNPSILEVRAGGLGRDNG